MRHPCLDHTPHLRNPKQETRNLSRETRKRPGGCDPRGMDENQSGSQESAVSPEETKRKHEEKKKAEAPDDAGKAHEETKRDTTW